MPRRRDVRQRNFRYPVWGFRVGNPHHRIFQIQLLRPHRSELFVNPESGLGHYANDVAQIIRRAELDLLLLKPSYVVRPEEPIDPCWEFHSCARIREEEFLAPRHIQHATQHSQLLVHPRCLQHTFLHGSTPRLDDHSLLEPSTKVHLDIVGGQFGEFGFLKHGSQMLQSALIDAVGLRRAERGLGKILQIKIRPFPKR
jgi:hypothetical protein